MIAGRARRRDYLGGQIRERGEQDGARMPAFRCAGHREIAFALTST
jgi:hypothetical protein